MPRNAPTAEQIAKLPKYAQDYIRALETETEEANRQRNSLFDSQEITPITFEPTISLNSVPRFLKSDINKSGRDHGQVKFWMHGTRWERHATRDYFEITRGISMGGRFSQAEMDAEADAVITVRASDGRVVVEPMSSQEVLLRYKRYV